MYSRLHLDASTLLNNSHFIPLNMTQLPMILPYSKSDQSDLIHLLRLNTPKYFAPEEEKDLINYLNNDPENYFIIKENNNILGAGGFNWFDEKQTARISWDFIHPEHQGKGLGKALTNFRIGKIKEESPNCKIIVRTSQHVFDFYGKLGFVLKEVKEGYWAEGFDLYLMEYER